MRGRFFLLSAALACFVSCKDWQDVSVLPDEETSSEPIVKIVTGEEPVDTNFIYVAYPFDCVALNKSASTEYYAGAKFHDCGSVRFTGRTYYATTIIGNQRWLLEYYSGAIDGNGEISYSEYAKSIMEDGEELWYYPRHFAYTFENTPSVKNRNLPEGFEAQSNWRVPSQEDFSNLYRMIGMVTTSAQEINDKLFDGLELITTNAYRYETQRVCAWDDELGKLVCETTSEMKKIHAGASLFWDSYQKGDVFGYAGYNEEHGVFMTCQANVDVMMLPIRLVQTVKPIFYEEDVQ